MLLLNETGEEKRVWGVLESDDGLWDFSDVRFDDMPDIVQAVLCYYLFLED